MISEYHTHHLSPTTFIKRTYVLKYMNRREYLASTSLFVGGVAGCAEDPTTQQSTTESESTPDPTPFELVGVDAPEEVEIGQSVSYAFEIRNTAEQEQVFETDIRTRLGEHSDWGIANTWTERMPAGETRLLESEPFTANYMGDFAVDIAALDERITIVFSNANLEYGYNFDIWNGATVSVVDVEFANQIGSYVPENGQFARAYVSATNASNEVVNLPAPQDFSVLVGNTEYEPLNIQEGDFYEGGEVQPEILREGFVTFEVGDNVAIEDIVVVWSITQPDGSVSAYWTEDGERE